MTNHSRNGHAVKRPLAELEAENIALKTPLNDYRSRVNVLTDALIAITAHFDELAKEQSEGGLCLQEAIDASDMPF